MRRARARCLLPISVWSVRSFAAMTAASRIRRVCSAGAAGLVLSGCNRSPTSPSRAAIRFPRERVCFFRVVDVRPVAFSAAFSASPVPAVLASTALTALPRPGAGQRAFREALEAHAQNCACLLYTSDAADEEDSVDLGGR